MRFSRLSPREQHTARLLLWAALFNGVVQSLNMTQDIIARKALHAEVWQLTLMVMIWPVTNFCSIWWGRLFESSRHKSRYFLVAGVLGRLTLVYGLWMTGMNEFMILLGLLYSFNSLLIPAQNSIFQKNIAEGKRAKIFGYTTSLTMLITIGFTFIAGRMLDSRESFYKLILAFTALAGFVSTLMLSLIRFRKNSQQYRPFNWKEVLVDPIIKSLATLKNNQQFSRFERSFSIYGMGFIMMQPVIPIFLVDKMKLTYTGNFVAKGVIAMIPILLFSPYLGKLHDKLHPFRFISIFFGLLAVFPLLLMLSAALVPWHILAVAVVYLAYAVFGLAMAGVSIAWTMGSIHFAGKEDASFYQSVHVTMTGIRGVLAPVLGMVLHKVFGLYSVFGVAACFLITASFISWRDNRKLKIEN
ncbi:MAG: MFS transporter [Candidatus Cloacimonetes bacterium]|nr:MFS transporter [Candidatus Cloacimonadota bacterium]